MRHDQLADMFCVIKNAESIGKNSCITPASNLAKNILKIMQVHKYIGNFEYIDDGKGGKFRIELLGKINSCGVIKPRFDVKKDEFIKWEKHFLPAKGLGFLILSTSKGVMDHNRAKTLHIGGKLLGFMY